MHTGGNCACCPPVSAGIRLDKLKNCNDMKRTLFCSAIVAVAVLALQGCRCDNGHGLAFASPEEMGMNPEKLSRVDSVINKAIEEHQMPGAVLSVVRDDKIVFLKAYGNKSVVPDTVAMTTDAIFDLASCSKPIGTTLSFMQLIEDGYVRLTDNVDRYIPGFAPWVDPDTGKKVDITVQDLLTHSSGLPAYVAVDRLASRFGEPCPDSLMYHIARELPRNFRPKTDFTYSCLNFVTLQNILQNVTGQKLEDYAQKNVFDALGLEHTCYNVYKHPELMPYVVPTEVQADGKPLLGTVHDPIAWRLNAGNSGNAGVFSSAGDLSVIAAAIMNGGAVNGRRILGPLTVELMATMPADNDPEIGRSLGWDVLNWGKGDIFDRTRTLDHNGYTGTLVVIDLESKTAVILLANRVHPEDKGNLSRVRATVCNIVAGSIEK